MQKLVAKVFLTQSTDNKTYLFYNVSRLLNLTSITALDQILELTVAVLPESQLFLGCVDGPIHFIELIKFDGHQRSCN